MILGGWVLLMSEVLCRRRATLLFGTKWAALPTTLLLSKKERSRKPLLLPGYLARKKTLPLGAFCRPTPGVLGGS